MSECCGFEIKDSEEFGRLIIAKRDFRFGELILDEEPLLTAQLGRQDVSASSQTLSEDLNKLTMFCVGCFKTLSIQDLKFCRICNWPVCCYECGLESLHARYECSLFKEKKIGVSAKVYKHIYILRGVLMYQDENTTAWDQLASLSATYSLNLKGYNTNTSKKTIYRANFFLRQSFQIDVDEKIVGQIMGACKVNSFEMSGEDEHGNSYKNQAVYYVGSMFSHSCAPNAVWTIPRSDCNGIKRGHLRVYARRNILRGDHICISYISYCFAVDTAERKSHIRDHYRFECKCSRCLDPTEFSLYTEAVRCPSCGDETLTADNSSVESSTWTCNHCGMCQDHSFNKMLLENFDPSFIWECPAMDLSTGKCGLSSNHREIIRTTYFWIEERYLDHFKELHQHSTACDEMFVKFMTAAMKCLKVLRMFSSMTSTVELEYWLARIIASYYFKTVDFLSTPYDSYLPEEKLAILSAICAHLKTAYNIMEWFPFDFMPLLFRQGLIDEHKFWNNKLNGLKDSCRVDLGDSSEELTEGGVKFSQVQSSPNNFKENSDEVTSSEPKTSASELRDPVTKTPHEESELSTEAVEVEKLPVSQSSNLVAPDVIFSPGDSKLVLIKPPVSLLAKWDFYFDA